MEAHVDVLAVALDVRFFHEAADGLGAGKPDVGCRWPQSQLPSFAFGALCLVVENNLGIFIENRVKDSHFSKIQSTL